MALKEGGEGKEFVLAIDLGASKLRIGIFRGKRLLNLKIFQTPRNISSNEFTQTIISYVKEMLLSSNVTRLKGIGIASIGPLDLQEGKVTGAPNLNPSSFELRDPLGYEFKTKVVMANDCIAAVWGEYVFGGWRKYQDQVYITLSSGIGVGVIIEGRLLLGRRGNAHELGHGVIDFDSNMICGCGGIGHWEAYAGGKNLKKVTRILAQKWHEGKTDAYKEAIKEGLEGPSLFLYAKKGDPFALFLVDYLSKVNAAGLATVIAAYDPEVIHLGGSIYLNNEDLLLPRIKKYLKRYSLLGLPILRRTTFDHLTPLYGAATLIYETPENLEKYSYKP